MKTDILLLYICCLFFPYYLRAQVMVNHYDLYCKISEHGGQQNPSLNRLIRENTLNVNVDKIAGINLFIENRPRSISMNPIDQFDARNNNLRQISAERIKLKSDSRFYCSGDDGAGYEITKNLDISAKGTGFKLNFRF